MENKEAVDLGIRYLVLVLFGAGLGVFYFLFTPLTVWPVYGVLNLVDSGVRLFEGSVIFFSGNYIEIIGACVAGAAYYLLLILNLATPMDYLKRAESLLFLFGSFLLLNIFRIVLFSLLFVSGFQFFDLAHKLIWYFGSTILVVVIWFVNVWLFDIREIPVYSDVMELFRDAFGVGGVGGGGKVGRSRRK